MGLFLYIETNLIGKSYKAFENDLISAIGHDRRFDNLGATGASGLFLDNRTIGADWKFVSEELTIASMPFDSKTRLQAATLGIGLGLASLPKTLATLMHSTQGLNYILMWNSIGNRGANAPSK
ncbi:hypothetical protein [Sphingobacterium sp. LRF_L2]|uniref:hypothetical protein n=1 Tax=Sphingobacterium sp. LRF_L2 TaxID=3369421 RepID=UPI003F5F7E6B